MLQEARWFTIVIPAKALVDLEAARFLSFKALWALSEGRPADIEVAMAQARVSEACSRIADRAQGVYAGLGYLMRCDLQLFTRRIHAGGVAFGTPDFHRETLAKAMKL